MTETECKITTIDNHSVLADIDQACPYQIKSKTKIALTVNLHSHWICKLHTPTDRDAVV